MHRINVLPKSVAELIAAGEVVERPSSAVKELIENSIDAKANSITVEIKNGGVKYIRVSDDGCGIHREDVRTAFISHATSKISTGEDLDAIFTLGFRGEALPSIAAVSKLSMLTKTSDEETGTLIEIEGGEEKFFDDAGCPNGTTIIIKDLFFNTPARMKFLKKDMTEASYVTDVVSKIAISHPEVRFSLIKDGKQVLSTPGNGNLRDTVFSVFGKEISDSLIPCDYEYKSIKINGFISRPLNNRANRNLQYCFVNGRYVRMSVAAAALDEAYKNRIMVGKFPVCFLFVDIPAGKTDVNVHPAKTEIRFSDDAGVFEAIFYAAKNALNKGDTLRPEVSLRDKRDITAKNAPAVSQLSFVEDMPVKKQVKNNTVIDERAEKTSETETKIAEGEDKNEPSDIDFPKTLAEIAGTKKEVHIFDESGSNYSEKDNATVVREKNSDVFSAGPRIAVFRDTSDVFKNRISEEEAAIKNAMDGTLIFNSSHNKTSVTYENVVIPEKSDKKNDFKTEEIAETEAKKTCPHFTVIGEVFRTYILVESEGKLLIIDKHAAHERMIFNEISEKGFSEDSQILLSPVSVPLSGREYAAVLENLNVFSSGGFLVEDFGGGSVIVRECPVTLQKEDISAIITEMAGELLKGNMKPVPEKLDWLYHSTACRAAVKAGDDMKKEEIMVFVEKLLSDENIRYCPHGRPVMYELTKREIEKQFGRV